MSNGKLSGKVAIITGASSGIGQGIALKYAAEGASVVIDYFGNDAGAVSAKQQIESAGGKAIIVAADVSKPAEVTSLVDQAWSAFGKADILVNNAGVEKGGDFADVPEADYDFVLNVNLKGPLFYHPGLCQTPARCQYARPCHQHELRSRRHGVSAFLHVLRR